MRKRYAYIWFQFLLSDWLVIRKPEFKDIPFVFAALDHGRMIITATNNLARQQGVKIGMRLADAKAVCPQLGMIEDKTNRLLKILIGLGVGCCSFFPIISFSELFVVGF